MPTAAAFADDLRRYLDDRAGQRARPDTFGYRAAKFVRRHRGAVAVASAVAFALMATTGVAIWQWLDALAEQRRADFGHRSALAAEAFASSWLERLAAKQEPAQRRALLDVGRNILSTQSFDDDPLIQANLKYQLAARYSEIGAQDVHLELMSEVQQLLERTDKLVDRAYAASAVAGALDEVGRVSEAMAQIERARELLRRQFDPEAMAQCLQFESYIATDAGDHQRAVEAAREGHQLLARHGRGGILLYRVLRGAEARALAKAGRPREAIAAAQSQLAELEARGDRDSRTYGLARSLLAEQELEAGDVSAARRALSEPWAGQPEHAELAWRARARLDELDGRLLEAWRAYRAHADAQHQGHALLEAFAAEVDALRLRLRLDAQAALRDDLPRVRALGERATKQGAAIATALALVEARVQIAQGRPEAALGALEPVRGDPADPLFGELAELASVAELAAGRPEQACRSADELLLDARKRRGSAPAPSLWEAQAQLWLSRCRAAVGDNEAARVHAAEALRVGIDMVAPDHHWRTEAARLAGR